MTKLFSKLFIMQSCNLLPLAFKFLKPNLQSLNSATVLLKIIFSRLHIYNSFCCYMLLYCPSTSKQTLKWRYGVWRKQNTSRNGPLLYNFNNFLKDRSMYFWCVQKANVAKSKIFYSTFTFLRFFFPPQNEGCINDYHHHRHTK